MVDKKNFEKFNKNVTKIKLVLEKIEDRNDKNQDKLLKIQQKYNKNRG